MEDSKDMALHVHIKYSKPVEMQDFITTASGINNLYNCYVQKHADSDMVRDSRLYIEKVREGSIEMFLCEQVASSLIPFAENMNIMLEFGGYIKRIIDYYTKRDGDKPDLDLAELKAVKDLARSTCNDFGGKTILGVVYKSSIEVKYENCEFNFPNGNGMIKQLDDDIEAKKAKEPKEEVYDHVLMTIYQMRSDSSTDKGNKAVISSISDKKLGLLFNSEELKAKILYSDINPTKVGYYVDVVAMVANERLAAYKVTALHDMIELDDSEWLI